VYTHLGCAAGIVAGTALLLAGDLFSVWFVWAFAVVALILLGLMHGATMHILGRAAAHADEADRVVGTWTVYGQPPDTGPPPMIAGHLVLIDRDDIGRLAGRLRVALDEEIDRDLAGLLGDVPDDD
jgi:hypothetical protein